MGASCSLDPGSEEVEECGKRLSESSWASEDLSCSSKMRKDEVACRGSPEWAGPADSQRAVSLDAAESAAAMSNQALVRSTALEDLTCVDDRSSWVNPAEEKVIGEQPEAAAAAAATLPTCSSEPRSDVLQAELGWRKAPERDSLLTKVPSGAAAQKSSSDSSSHTASHSKADICDDSDTPSTVVPTTGTAELQKTSPRSSPSTKSLVPVFKGLFAVLSPPQFNSCHSFPFQMQLLLCVPPHSPSNFCLRTQQPPPTHTPPQEKLVVLPPHFSFWFHGSVFAAPLAVQPSAHKNKPLFWFAQRRCACCVAVRTWRGSPAEKKKKTPFHWSAGGTQRVNVVFASLQLKPRWITALQIR